MPAAVFVSGYLWYNLRQRGGKNNVTCVIIPFGDIHKKVLYE